MWLDSGRACVFLVVDHSIIILVPHRGTQAWAAVRKLDVTNLKYGSPVVIRLQTGVLVSC